MNGFLQRGRERAEEFIRSGVDLWLADGRIDRKTADGLLASLNTPEVAQGLVHAGAHFAISLPLRFPLGAIARFFYTLILRIRAEGLGLFHHKRPVTARSLHTLPVLLFSLLPGFGRLAYFFSPALMRQRLLFVIPLDQIARKLPLRVYQRFHLEVLFVYWAEGHGTPYGLKRFAPGRLLAGIKSRLSELSPLVPQMSAVLAVDAVFFAIGVYLYLSTGPISTHRDVIWWFEERGAIATLDVVQLIIASGAGMAAYVKFWRHSPDSTEEAFGIFLWGIGGAGLLLFAIEDYFTIHETLFRWLGDMTPGFTNSPDDVVIVGYAVIGLFVLYVFHTELMANRASSTLLVAAALASIVMVVTDAFALNVALKALEQPAQTLAATLLMFAFLTRYREVQSFQLARTGENERELVTAGGGS